MQNVSDEFVRLGRVWDDMPIEKRECAIVKARLVSPNSPRLFRTYSEKQWEELDERVKERLSWEIPDPIHMY